MNLKLLFIIFLFFIGGNPVNCNNKIPVLELINRNLLPKHVAIIMDGNGRWATRKGKERTAGHAAGVPVFKKIVEECNNLKIKYLSIYAFSKENWKRPQNEVNFIFDLMNFSLEKELNSLVDANIHLRFIGDIESLSQKTKKLIQIATNCTKNCNGMELIIAINYSGSWDVCNAINSIIKDFKTGSLNSDFIDESILSNYLQTNGIPNPDFLIRTSGERRISNFYSVQSGYTELYFTDILWPDFSVNDLHEAFWDYQNRNRRFGSVK